MKKVMKRAFRIILGVVLMSNVAIAQESVENTVLVAAPAVDAAEEDNGWLPRLQAGATFSMGHSSNVPGTAEGVSYLFGYQVVGRLDYLGNSRQHEWLNGMNLGLGFSRTPVLDVLIKSTDTVDYRTAYRYHFRKASWMGPFVAARLSTSMLRTHGVHAEDTNVIFLEKRDVQLFDDAGGLVDADGGVIDPSHASVSIKRAGEKFELTGPFAPLMLKQSVGMFATPIDKDHVALDVRLGMGAWENFVQNGFALDDDERTADYVEYRRMENSVQVGAEAGVAISGQKQGILTYEVSALFMQPFAHDSDDERDLVKLLNQEYEARLGVAMSPWLSLSYAFKAYHQPLVVEGFQIQNSLLLSVGISLPGVPVTPQELPHCEPCPSCDGDAGEEEGDGDGDAGDESVRENVS